MKIHRASALGLSTRPVQSVDASAFPLAEAEWVTLKRGDELMLVRAIGVQLAKPDRPVVVYPPVTCWK